jgi:hypothetical protein
MLKPQVSKIKKVLTILLAVLFVASVTAIAASAHGGGGWGWGGHPYWGYGTGCVWVNGNWTCPSYVGMPYTMQASAPAVPAKDPDPSPNLAGATLFPETESKDPGTSTDTETSAATGT